MCKGVFGWRVFGADAGEEKEWGVGEVVEGGLLGGDGGMRVLE